MSALDNQTKANASLALYGSGGGSPNLDLSTLTLTAGSTTTILETFPGVGQLQTISDATIVGTVRIDDIASGVVLGDSFGNEAIFSNGIFTCSMLSSPQVFSQVISTTYVDLDGQVLTANATELLLNGSPLATLSNLSSIGDWAQEPAVSTIQAAGYPMIDIPQITGFSNQLLLRGDSNGPLLTMAYDALSAVSSQFIFDTGAGPLMRYRGGNLDVSSITTSNITTVTATALSTLTVISTISSLVLEGQLINTSTLFANSFLSTPDIEVSTINGAQFGNSSITVEVVGVSSLVANSISSIGAEIREAFVSTLQFNPSFNPSLDVNLGLGSLFGNLAGAAAGGIGVLVGAAGLGTGIAALAQGRQTNNINSNSYELVNGTTQLQISTLGTAFSTIYRFVSSVAENVPGEEYFVSSIHSPGVAIRSLSDPLNTVSAPTSTIQSFGQWVALDANLPIPSTVSSFQQLFTSSFAASTILAQNNVGVRGGAPYFNSPSGQSTFEVYEASAPQYSGALRANQINFSFAGLTSNDFTQDVLLFSQGSNNRLTTGGGRVVAYLTDIPAPPATVSSFTDASISSATISSVNGGIPYTTANPPPIQSTISSFLTASISSATISSINGGIPFTTANPPPVADTSTILVSSIGSIGGVSSLNIVPNSIASLSIDTLGRFTEIGRNFNLQAQSTGTLMSELLVDSTGAGGLGVFRLATNGIGSINGSTIAISTNQLQVNTISTNTVGVREVDFVGISTVSFSTSTAAGGQGQPAGRLVMGGNDLDIGANQLWTGKINLGIGNSATSQTEINFYNPAGLTARGLGLGGNDLTIRVQSTINSGTNNGYILDTTINPPFFSTLAGTSTALMAVFPSTNFGVLGVSTLSVVPPQPAASFLSRSTQTVAANTPLTLWHEVAGASVGSAITQSTTALVIGQAGVYDIETSIQFDKSGLGVTVADFWFRKNGTDIPDSASQITIQGNTGECLGNVSIFEQFAAGDKLELVIASADNTLAATFFQSTVTTPYTRPAVPSVITNIKKLG